MKGKSRPEAAPATVVDSGSTRDSLTDALNTARRFGAVFPCRDNKRPYTAHGFHEASADPAQIRQWWSKWPHALLGVPTGRTFDVLDVDTDGDRSGFAEFNEVKRAGLVTGKPLAIVKTRRGGLHLYLRPSGRGNGSLGPRGIMLDYRGTGGYCITPPSAGYEVVQGWDPDADGRADWDAIRDHLCPPRRYKCDHILTGNHRNRSIAGVVQWLARCPEGGRNEGLYWAACTAFEKGHEDLSAIADTAHGLGLDPAEIGRTIDSARRHVLGEVTV